jgi:hypothetical protein
MICASLVAIRPLLVKYAPSLFPASTDQGSTYTVKQSWRPPISQPTEHKIWSQRGQDLELASSEGLNRTESHSGLEEGIKMTTHFEMEVETMASGPSSRDGDFGAKECGRN